MLIFKKLLIRKNCFQINDFAVTTLILALEGNNSLTSLNLEGNSANALISLTTLYLNIKVTK